MGAFFKPSEEPGVKRAKRSGATLIPGSSDGTLCAAIAEQMSGVARSLRRKTLSLSLPCGWVHFKLPKWVKSKLALTYEAHAVLGDVQAIVTVRHYPDPQYPGSYILDARTDRANSLALGTMGRKQEQRAQALLPGLREQVEAALVA